MPELAEIETKRNPNNPRNLIDVKALDKKGKVIAQWDACDFGEPNPSEERVSEWVREQLEAKKIRDEAAK